MAGESKCFALVRGRAMRVTKTDGCGAPILGDESQVVSDGFISVALTANTDEGTTISVQNAAGKTCILDEPCPTFTGYSAEVQFCSVDPALFSLMAGQAPVLDPDGGTVGFRVNAGVDACGSGFALELWSQVPAGACEEGTGEAYGYFLIPFLRGGVLGDFTVANDAINFTLTGATSRDGSTWGVGPYDVVDNGLGPVFTPGPLLEPIDTQDHLHMQLTTVPPPDPMCGFQSVGTAATGADAGTPGDFTPANSFPPADLASATGLTASPNTAWATGEYVVLGDGSQAHWSGTAWASGIAP